MLITAWRGTALAHPCLLADETTHPRFGHLLPQGSLVLTVNAGYE
jgi:hypothetical protein